jgi:hypothetical protein
VAAGLVASELEPTIRFLAHRAGVRLQGADLGTIRLAALAAASSEPRPGHLDFDRLSELLIDIDDVRQRRVLETIDLH